MVDLRKFEVCDCIKREVGVLMPRTSPHNIVRFIDEFNLIDTILYEDKGNYWSGRKREFIISDTEYFKRKLHGG